MTVTTEKRKSDIYQIAHPQTDMRQIKDGGLPL